MFRLMKRTYLIVGHSSGIGLALSRNILALGHTVFGLSRRASGLRSPDLVEIGAPGLGTGHQEAGDVRRRAYPPAPVFSS